MATPFLIVGDAPFRPTGLSRILTDLVLRICGGEEGIPPLTSLHNLDVGVVGYQPWDGLPKTGIPFPRDPQGNETWWRGWAFSDLTNHGREAVQTAYRAWFGNRRGILLSVWDPGRCHALAEMDLPVEKWGYFAIDAANMNGGISGPAGLAVNAYDRVLAYTQFGKKVLETATDLEVEVLPHGIDLATFTREMTAEERAGGIRRLFPAGYPEGTLVIGCVATNQPRKDLGLFVQVLRELRSRCHNVHGWLHTDRLITEAWSIPQLASDAQLEDHLTVTTQMSDRELAVCYSLCVATVAPGRGEGFCYPGIESLGCGVPVVTAAHSGLAEFVPYQWQVEPVCTHLVGPYALARPILDPLAVAFKLEDILAVETSRYLLTRNVVEKLDWPTLWPSWAEWISRGVEAFEKNLQEVQP